MKKRLISAILVLALLFTGAISAAAYEVTGFEVTAKNAMLVSLDTGEILYEKNADDRLYPASITRLMTAAVILDSCDVDNTQVTMGASAYQKILGTDSSVLNMKIGETLNGKDALAAILISSAGDVVYAYAEALFGSVDAFVEKMNEKAAELNLNGTHYENPIGLHDDNHYTTVRDIYQLSVYVLKKYPLVSELTRKARYTISATNMSDSRILSTTNLMLDANTSYYYPYCTGLKTGFTDEAGRCLVSTASYEGYRYLCITMNCPTQNGTRTEFTTSRQLYRWAFNNFEYKAVLDISKPVAEIAVSLSSDYDYLSLYPSAQITAILPKEADNSTVIVVPHPSAEQVKAPIQKGEVFGTAEVIYAEQVIGSVDLVAGCDIASSPFLVAWDGFCRVVSSTPFKVVAALIVLAVVVLIAYTLFLNRRGKKKPARKLRYIPYDETKEEKRHQKAQSRLKKQGRPSLSDPNDADENDRPGDSC